MDAITTEQMLKFINEIHEYLRSGDGDWSIDIDSPEVGIIKAIRAALLERDALKAEVERLNNQHWVDLMELDAARKAEAELAKWKPLIEAAEKVDKRQAEAWLDAAHAGCPDYDVKDDIRALFAALPDAPKEEK
jgi:hypothetical protein